MDMNINFIFHNCIWFSFIPTFKFSVYPYIIQESQGDQPLDDETFLIYLSSTATTHTEI